MCVRSENAHRFVSSHTAGNGKSVPVDGLIRPLHTPCRDIEIHCIIAFGRCLQQLGTSEAFTAHDGALRADEKTPVNYIFLTPENYRKITNAPKSSTIISQY